MPQFRIQMKADLAAWRVRLNHRVAVLRSATKKRDHAQMVIWSANVHEAQVKIAELEKALGIVHKKPVVVKPAPPKPAVVVPAKPVKPVVPPKPAKPNYGKLLAAEMDWAVAHEPQVFYSQKIRMQIERWKSRTLPITDDCSGSVTGLCYAVGLPDINGLNYSHLGYTGTILEHARAKGLIVPKSKLKVGYLVVHGPGTGAHVTMVRKIDSSGITLWSHGQNRGPIFISWDEELKYQGPVTTCIKTY